MLELSREIKLVVSDFDGVFTDGSVYVSENYDVQKKLNYKDIMGVFMLKKKGIDVAIISGEESRILDFFKEKLELKEVFGGIRQKGIILNEIMQKYNLKSSQVLYIGDDINDISAMELAEYRIAPKNVNPVLPFRVEKLQITENFGGDGAIREIADILVNL